MPPLISTSSARWRSRVRPWRTSTACTRRCAGHCSSPRTSGRRPPRALSTAPPPGTMCSLEGGTPVRGTAVAAALAPKANASQAPGFSAGGREACRLPGTKLYPDTGNTERFYRRLHQLRRPVEPVPPTARALICNGSSNAAVPDRVQPRLRAHQAASQPSRGPNLTVGSAHVPSGDLPSSNFTGHPNRPGRPRSPPPRGFADQPGLGDEPEPARLLLVRHRRAASAGRAVPGQQARSHAFGADPGRPDLHRDGQLRTEAIAARGRRRPHRGLVPYRIPRG